jgi:hypothetical protein
MKFVALNVVIKGFLGIAGVSCLLLGWAYWVLTSERRDRVSHLRENSRPEASPSNAVARSDGPGRFKVNGVDRKSNAETSWQVAAASEASAREDAERLGMSVTKVERIT